MPVLAWDDRKVFTDATGRERHGSPVTFTLSFYLYIVPPGEVSSRITSIPGAHSKPGVPSNEVLSGSGPCRSVGVWTTGSSG